MDNELKVKYENFKSKYKVIPIEMIVEGDKIKYNRAKKKAEDIEFWCPETEEEQEQFNKVIQKIELMNYFLGS